MPLCDVHCHLLPGIDDGCQTVEDSIALLEESYFQGVDFIAATPHYYPIETVDNFLARRSQAVTNLALGVRKANVENRPTIRLGAEVAYHNGLVYEKQLERLCLGKTRYLLLEMPFSKWEPSVLRDVQMMINTRGVKPIIAHLERFLQFNDKATIQSLLDMDVLIQMNAGFILDKKTQKKAKKMLQQGIVHLLGSDSHNMSTRMPNLGPAYDQLDAWGMSDVADELAENALELFGVTL